MFCPSCGNKLPEDAAFCTKCGTKLDIAIGNAQTEPLSDAAPAVSPAPVEGATPPAQQAVPVGQEQVAPMVQQVTPVGQEAAAAPAVAGGEATGSNKTVLAVAIAGAVIAIVAVALIVFLGFGNRGASTQTQSAGGGGQAGPGQQQSISGYDAIASQASSKQTGNMKLMSTDVSNYPNVKLYFTYEDSNGNAILLNSPTAGVRETISDGDEIERTVRSIQRLEGNQGLSIDIVADKSGSMSGDMNDMKKVMTDFVNSLDYGSGDMAEIITFDSFIMFMCTYTNDKSLLANGISNMVASGETALYDALINGINRAATRSGARCVIGFTDGMDNRSSSTYNDVIKLANQKEVPVYLIGTGSADSAVLRDICSQTGGKYWDIKSVRDMNDVLKQIYSQQKEMYCIEYESDGSADPYAARAVSCALSDGQSGYVLKNQSFTASKTVTVADHSSRYEVIGADISWTEANDICLEKGGHLATITSQAEMDELVRLADESGLKYLWIGGYTSVNNGKAYGHWITGEPFNYTAWYKGEPSRNDQDGTPEFYLMMWNVDDNWTWNDQRNDVVNDTGLAYFAGKTGYIIEYES